MAIETPKYKVLSKDGRIEVRQYEAYITASITTSASSYSAAANKAFSSLADFIFGNNNAQSSISMTAPVVSEKISMTAPVTTSVVKGDQYLTSFSMPSKYKLANLPKPNNDSVLIKVIPSHKELVIMFSGYTTEKKIKDKEDILKDFANKNNLKISGNPKVSRYDPPWKPGIFRKNEVSFLLS